MARFIRIMIVLLAMAQGAWAQGNGNGQDNGNGGNGNSEAGSKAGGNGNGNGNGDNGQSGDGNNGNGNAGDVVDDVVDVPEADVPADMPVTPPPANAEQLALEAVQSGRSVPLETLLPDIRARTGGELIDAQLLTVDGSLLYAVKVMTPAGHVGTEYYDARSGQHVETR